MFQKTSLQNGLRVLTQRMDGTNSVTVLILAGAGSRYETKEQNGISHFLEHMFFKGAKKYVNTKAVSEAIDAVGGDFNAFTGKEYAGYYVKVASEHIELAMDVLSDMLLHARFDAHEIDKERGVILEEFNMYQDTPMYQVGWDFERLLFGDQPLGWDQVGSKELIRSVTQNDFVKYKKALYTADNTIVSIVGKIDNRASVSLVEQYFDFNNDKKSSIWKPYQPYVSENRVHLTHKKTEQGHIVVGFYGYPETHKDHYALKVLSVLLGGNMSSRMFLNVREAKGLAYYIQTSTDDYADVGVISTRAGVDVNRCEEAVRAIVEEYRHAVTSDIPANEVKKAKDYLKGKLVLRLEDSEEYAHLLGKYELLHDMVKMPKEIIRGIEKVEVFDVIRVAKDLFKQENLRLATIGPFEDRAKFESSLDF
ncbi:insulinase family protein [Candidatus Peregrinibacteria bacterium]|nr:insulinase family protein [Candidatus Peregrinibacteria bacterium]